MVTMILYVVIFSVLHVVSVQQPIRVPTVATRLPGNLLECDFEDTDCGFRDISNNKVKWKRECWNDYGCMSLATKKSKKKKFYTSILQSPVITGCTLNNCCLLFDYYLDASESQLTIEIEQQFQDGRRPTYGVWGPGRSEEHNWRHITVNLNQTGDYKINFIGKTTSKSDGDIAIDNVVVSSGSCDHMYIASTTITTKSTTPSTSRTTTITPSTSRTTTPSSETTATTPSTTRTTKVSTTTFPSTTNTPTTQPAAVTSIVTEPSSTATTAIFITGIVSTTEQSKLSGRSSSANGLSQETIISISLSLVCIVVIATIVIICIRRHKKKKQEMTSSPVTVPIQNIQQHGQQYEHIYNVPAYNNYTQLTSNESSYTQLQKPPLTNTTDNEYADYDISVENKDNEYSLYDTSHHKPISPTYEHNYAIYDASLSRDKPSDSHYSLYDASMSENKQSAATEETNLSISKSHHDELAVTMVENSLYGPADESDFKPDDKSNPDTNNVYLDIVA